MQFYIRINYFQFRSQGIYGLAKYKFTLQVHFDLQGSQLYAKLSFLMHAALYMCLSTNCCLTSCLKTVGTSNNDIHQTGDATFHTSINACTSVAHWSVCVYLPLTNAIQLITSMNALSHGRMNFQHVDFINMVSFQMAL
jgi:hypothetical protein